MRKRSGKLLLFLLLFALIIGVCVGAAKLWDERRSVPDTIDSDDYGYDGKADTVFYNGREYAPRALETLLIIGVDKYGTQQTEEYINSEQSDFLMLLVLDHEAESYYAIPVNRDTMAQITILGLDGRSAGSFTGQLALAHTYGSGGTDSCRNTVRAVSGLLFDTAIDHYVSITMDAVPILNDAVGGVTLSLMDDFTDLDPAMAEGAEFTLIGENALRYVRARSGLQDSRNVHRMERQAQYISALKKAYESASLSDADVSQLMLDVNEYLVSDCPADKLSHLYDQLVRYSFEGYREIEGESVKGEEYIEFYADDEALRDMVLSCFYTPLG